MGYPGGEAARFLGVTTSAVICPDLTAEHFLETLEDVFFFSTNFISEEAKVPGD